MNQKKLVLHVLLSFYRNFSGLCKEDEFLDMRLELLVEITRSDHLQAEEQTVIEAMFRWLKHELEREPFVTKVIRFRKVRRAGALEGRVGVWSRGGYEWAKDWQKAS